MLNCGMRSPLREEAGADGSSGGGGTPTFDPAKFRSEVLADVNKSINGVVARLEKMLKPKADETKPDAEPEPDEGGEKKTTDPRVRLLEKRLADMASKFDASEKARLETEVRAKAERMAGALRTELLKYVPAERIESALRIFGPDVKYAEDGTIVGGADESPLADFVGSAIKNHEYLLPAKPVGGAGASGGNRKGTAAVTLDDIKPGMTKEAEAAALAAIRQALPGMQ